MMTGFFRYIFPVSRYLIILLFLFLGYTAYGESSGKEMEGDGDSEEIAHQWGKTDGFAISFFLGYTPELMNIHPYQQAGYINIEKPSGNSIDLALKYKAIFLYLRTGIGYTFPSPLSSSGTSGKVFTTSPKEYSGRYMKVPVIGGFNFFIQDQGSVQIGLGGVYLNGEQDYKYKDASLNTKLKGSTFGLMFQICAEMNISSNILVTSEVNLFQARTGAIPSGSSPNITRELDFSSLEFLVGIAYYFYQ